MMSLYQGLYNSAYVYGLCVGNMCLSKYFNLCLYENKTEPTVKGNFINSKNVDNIMHSTVTIKVLRILLL